MQYQWANPVLERSQISSRRDALLLPENLIENLIIRGLQRHHSRPLLQINVGEFQLCSSINRRPMYSSQADLRSQI